MTTQRAQIEISAKDRSSAVIKRIRQENERLNGSIRNTKSSNDSYNGSLQKTRNGMRSLRGPMSQMSYQIQDVAVQLQGGQNKMLIFTQQGSQMASVFGPTGIVVGAILAVGGAIAGAMLPSLFKAGDAMGDLDDISSELKLSFDDLDDSTGVLTERMEKLYSTSRQAFLTEVQQDAYDASKAMKTLNTEIINQTGELAGLDSDFERSLQRMRKFGEYAENQLRIDPNLNVKDLEARVISRYQEELNALSGELGLTGSDVISLYDNLELLKRGLITPEQFQTTLYGFGQSSEKSTELATSVAKLTESWTIYNNALTESQRILAGGTPVFAEPKGGKKTPESKGVVDLYPKDEMRKRREQVLDGEREALDLWLTQRNESIRQRWLAEQTQPWMVGVVDGETLDKALKGIDDRLEEQHEKEKRRLKEIADARKKAWQEGLDLFSAGTSLITAMNDARYDSEQSNLRNVEGLSKQEVAVREQTARKSFEKHKKFQVGMIGLNTAAAVMMELATNPEPFSKFTRAATIATMGAAQAIKANGQQFGSFPAATAISQPINNTTTNNQSVINNISITGGVGFGIKELQELFDSDNVAIRPGTAQFEALKNG